jgi:hypothetical protein
MSVNYLQWQRELTCDAYVWSVHAALALNCSAFGGKVAYVHELHSKVTETCAQLQEIQIVTSTACCAPQSARCSETYSTQHYHFVQ